MAEDFNKIYEMYDNNKLIQGNVIMKNISKEDKDIIDNRLTPQVSANGNDGNNTCNSYWSNFLFKDYPQKIKCIIDKIYKSSTRVKPIAITLSHHSDNKDMLNITTLFDYKRIYLSPMEYYYLRKPNSIKWQVNLSSIGNTNNNAHIQRNYSTTLLENELSCGMEFSQRKQKKSFFLQNTFYPTHNHSYSYSIIPLEYCIKYKRTKYENDFKRKTFATATKLIITHNLLKRPFLFRDYFPYDPINRINIQLSQRNITNICDEQNTSNEMLTNLPEQDYQLTAKISYEKNKLKSVDMKGFHIKLASSFIRSLNSLYVKNRFFLRRLCNFKHVNMQLNCEAGQLISLDKKDIEQLKVHEKFFVYNYRGVINPTGKCAATDKNHWYMLGSTAYALGLVKMLWRNLPMFSLFDIEKDGFQIMPFSFISGMLGKEQENKNIMMPIRVSTGIGVSVMSKLFAFEILFCPYVKKTGSDVHARFHVRFGVD